MQTARLYNRDRQVLQARGLPAAETISPSLCQILTVLEQSAGGKPVEAKD
jgi:hypothetical protein